MIKTYIIAISVILGILTLWIAVQHWARGFATRHPEFGPVREDGEDCGGLLCLCKNQATCSRNLLKQSKNDANFNPSNSNYQENDK
jgi:hypothetical protein